MHSHRTSLFLSHAHMEGGEALCYTLIFLLKIHSLCDLSVMDTIYVTVVYICVCLCLQVCACTCERACECVYIVTQSPCCRALSRN